MSTEYSLESNIFVESESVSAISSESNFLIVQSKAGEFVALISNRSNGYFRTVNESRAGSVVVAIRSDGKTTTAFNLSVNYETEVSNEFSIFSTIVNIGSFSGELSVVLS